MTKKRGSPEEEMRLHIELETEDLIARGVAPAEARRQAMMTFGGIDRFVEEGRDVRRWAWVGHLRRDVAYAVRSLSRNPGFAWVAIVTMAIGIGANTAMFSVVNGVLLRPLPYAEPHRLAMLWTQDVSRGIREEGTSLLNYRDWRAATREFDDLALTGRGREVFLTGGAEPVRVLADWASANLFPVLGVTPVLGRGFQPEDERYRTPGARAAEVPDADHPVIISHGLWRRQFGESKDVIGKLLEVNGERGRVIGVMPAGFHFPTRDTDLWFAMTGSLADRYSDSYRVVGRLKEGSTFAAAQTEMSAIGARLAREYPTTNPGFAGFDVNVVPLITQVTGRTLPLALWVLLGAVGLLLLIACANVANLSLARGAARTHEFAVRGALGAGRGHLIRQLLTESTTLSLLGGVAGLVVAVLLIEGLRVLAPPGIPRLDEVSIDGRILVFTLGMALLTGTLFGLVPALKLSRRSAGEAMQDRTRTTTGSIKLRQVRGLLIVTQCALAVTLLAAAGLLIRSFLLVQAVDPGYQREKLLVARVALVETAATTNESVATFTRRMLERVRGLPGVRRAGVARDVFFSHNADHPVLVEGPAGSLVKAAPIAVTKEGVSTDFLETMGVRLRAGRLLNADDDGASHAVVNQTFATHFFPGENPIGRRFSDGDSPGRPHFITVVGVVDDLHRQGLERAPVAEFYQLLLQMSTMDLVVRVERDAARQMAALRREIRSLDPHAVVLDVKTAAEKLDAFAAQRRFQTWVLGGFALVALLLSAIGIYGIVHYSVTERTHEIGVRIALGARTGHVLGGVLRDGLRLAVTGIGIGLVCALLLTRTMTRLLFEVRPNDPATFLAVVTILLAAAAAASYLPAARAARLDPLIALRRE